MWKVVTAVDCFLVRSTTLTYHGYVLIILIMRVHVYMYTHRHFSENVGDVECLVPLEVCSLSSLSKYARHLSAVMVPELIYYTTLNIRT